MFHALDTRYAISKMLMFVCGLYRPRYLMLTQLTQRKLRTNKEIKMNK